MVSSLWGKAVCPWRVKVESAIAAKLPAPLVDGIPGWIVNTQRYKQLISEISGADAAELTSWQLDYSTMSTYQPCDRS